jgi:hypothetical protein
MGHMNKTFLRVLIFIAVFAAFILPSRRAAETLWTRDVSLAPPAYFPILVQSSQGKFGIEQFHNLSPQSRIATEIADQDVDKINSDLRSSISAGNSKYHYFRIVGRGDKYTDVSLEVPTTGDFPPKGWYRIQNGSVHPQRIIFYGPWLGIFGLTLPAVAGIIAVLIYNTFIRPRGAKPLAPAILLS